MHCHSLITILQHIDWRVRLSIWIDRNIHFTTNSSVGDDSSDERSGVSDNITIPADDVFSGLDGSPTNVIELPSTPNDNIFESLKPKRKKSNQANSQPLITILTNVAGK